ncbi:hypothetical protein FLAG1_11093 [Fusarium langsethiae]|uniref:N-acetyltransferase domain-containing protein n=1 Tax=Fusarium langsethiae TaxID=179993 RepID=A0A0M9EML2_FUSLA|nr:hypothetical protein FLAG1_11093 [Fusarium langsethiae]GKU08424.1 unnamed protein product [Fusarium langsethiae]GKU10106.1 unnamed protein product [Fusarium langsethiae]
MSLLYETFERGDITEDMLDAAAELFTKNYGIWGSASKLCGKRVTLTAKGIREQHLPQDGECWYTRATSHGTLVGNAFICRWNHGGRTICWVTQLVVHKEYRGRGIASTLLRMSRADSDDMYGIMSSHPYTCVAATTVFGISIENLSLDFIREHAATVMKVSPIRYVKEAVLNGSLFHTTSTGLISGADTGFYVDHEEPLNALAHLRATSRVWPLEELPDGHEYLVLLPAKLRQISLYQSIN